MTMNIAHRGFSGEYPENTMLAFEKAAEAGCDGIELDVHLTKDGELVILHDEDISRTTDGSGLAGEYTLAELKRYNAGNSGCRQEIPTLREYFDFIRPKDLITNIELKNGVIWYEGMEQKLIDLIREYGLEDRVILSSFNHRSILLCKRIAPGIPCGFLCGCWLLGAGQYVSDYHVEYYHPQFHSLTEDSFEEIRARQVRVNAWTVDREDDMRRLIQMGAAGIITNHPERLRRVLDGEMGNKE